MATNVLEKLSPRENTMLAITLLVFIGLTVLLPQVSQFETLPNFFVVYGALLIALPAHWAFTMLLFLALVLFLPLVVNAYAYVFSFALSFVIVFVLVRKYFEHGSYYATISAVVLMTMLYNLLYLALIIPTSAATISQDPFVSIGIEVFTHGILAVIFYTIINFFGNYLVNKWR